MEYNKMQQVKRRFFAMRNGVIADTIRRAGFDYKIVFGLNLPQIVEIAESFGTDPELSAQLWQDVRTRESRLLAPMLCDPATLTADEASAMAREVNTTEVADILCHRLLRRRPDLADTVTARLLDSDNPLHVYTILRLWFNFLAAAPPGSEQSKILTAKISAILAGITPTPVTAPIIRALTEELSYRP